MNGLVSVQKPDLRGWLIPYTMDQPCDPRETIGPLRNCCQLEWEFPEAGPRSLFLVDVCCHILKVLGPEKRMYLSVRRQC